MIYGPSSHKVIQVIEHLAHKLKQDVTHAERELLEKAHALAWELQSILRRLHHIKLHRKFNEDKEIQSADQKGSHSKD